MPHSLDMAFLLRGSVAPIFGGRDTVWIDAFVVL
jgi:hypothetical protein